MPEPNISSNTFTTRTVSLPAIQVEYKPSKRGWYCQQLSHWHELMGKFNRNYIRKTIETMLAECLIHVAEPYVIVELALPVGKRMLYARGVSKCHEIELGGFDEQRGIRIAKSRAIDELYHKLQCEIAKHVV